MAQWLRLHLLLQRTWVGSLVGELRFCLPLGMAKQQIKIDAKKKKIHDEQYVAQKSTELSWPLCLESQIEVLAGPGSFPSALGRNLLPRRVKL